MLCRIQTVQGVHVPWSCYFRCPATLIVTVTQVISSSHTVLPRLHENLGCCRFVAGCKLGSVLLKHVDLQAPGGRLWDEFEQPGAWKALR